MRKFENLTPEQKRSMEEFFNRLQMQEYMERMQPNEDFIDEMLKDPESYLNALGQQFMKDHDKEIKQGFREGKKFATKVIEKL